MKKKLTVILLLIGQVSFAQYQSESLQNRSEPSPFNKFINQPNIEWAATVEDYIIFEKINLNKLLFIKFSNNEIKASLPLFGSMNGVNYMSYLLKDSLDEIVRYPLHRYGNMYDSNGNTIPSKVVIKPYELDTSALNSTDIAQIFYIQDGILKSYIPWVSPAMMKIANSVGEMLGHSEYFSTCFNYQYDYQVKKENKILFLGETKLKLRQDSIKYHYYQLKELYGRNLWETLSPYVWDNKLDVFTLNSTTKLKPAEISDSILAQINTVPGKENYYDPLGKFIQYQYLHDYFDLNNFKELQIVQDWYYNATENIVFNKIKELYLCAKKWTIKGEDKEASPILKIVFR